MKRKIATILALVITGLIVLAGCTGKVAPVSSPDEDKITQSQTVTYEDVSKEQAIDIVNDVYARIGKANNFLKTMDAINVDETQSIPEKPDYRLVVHESIKTMAELKACIETAFTSEYISKENLFEKAGNCFEDYDGHLYKNYTVAGTGDISEDRIDTLRILAQGKDGLTVEFDVYLQDKKYAGTKITLVKANGLWKLNDMEYIPVLH